MRRSSCSLWALPSGVLPLGLERSPLRWTISSSPRENVYVDFYLIDRLLSFPAGFYAAALITSRPAYPLSDASGSVRAKPNRPFLDIVKREP